MDKQICPLCTHMMERAEKPMTLSHKGYTATFDMPGWYCAECGESVHTGKDMQTSDRRLNTLKAQAENLLVPQEVRRIRRKLGLTQDMAGRILGGGPNAFHKYESGSVVPSQAISNLLRVLEAKPEALTVLDSPGEGMAAGDRQRRLGSRAISGTRIAKPRKQVRV
jgi:HTH-type transcriptional regulator/antitoxin MqsA